MEFDTIQLIGLYTTLSIALLAVLLLLEGAVVLNFKLTRRFFRIPLWIALWVAIAVVVVTLIASFTHPTRAARAQCRERVLQTVEAELLECSDLEALDEN